MNPPATDPLELQTGALATDAAPAVASGTPVPARCENCGADLHGDFCHRCGQSVHSPMRHAGHALEEMFESLWHLDGRVFRTLRDLPVPARVARGYLAGHRARYIAPLRLFVILSLLTFFVGQLTVDFSNPMRTDADADAIATAGTVAEVERRRDAVLAQLERARADTGRIPMADQPLRVTEDSVRKQAAARIAQLQAGPSAAVAATSDEADGPSLRIMGDEPWDAKSNPVDVRWLPAFADDWLNRKIGRALQNAPRLQHDEDLRRQVILGSVPTALFVLMPVFALLLKVFYLGSGRLYLEHLVVALYSHAFLLLALLAVFLLVGLEHLVAPHAPAAARVFAWLEGALWWAMPVYLLIMQKRVYGQGWGVTTLKYGVLGTLYLVLVGFAAFFAGVAGLARL